MRFAPRLFQGTVVITVFLSGVYYFIPALMETMRNGWLASNNLATFMIYLLSFGLLLFLVSMMGGLLKNKD